MTYTDLIENQITQLVSQGCRASDWKQVKVDANVDVGRFYDVNFIGSVLIGDATGTHRVDGVELPCGIYHASVANCAVGDHVRVAGVGSVISNYVIEDNVVIEDVAALTADSGASFGNGVELETVNEGGGRGVRIINDLTSQSAYVQAMSRHNAEFTKRLERLVDEKAKVGKGERGRVASGSRLIHCGVIHNVCFGAYSFIHGAQFLDNGTVNSCVEHPTEIGEGVQAKSFILSEGARVESGAILDKVFVGQNVKIGKQYSAENSLFFANCEAFHGEAVSLFAGPYTVTHHKSTLLIAGLFSFYNAGSGSNQSNHMYKLGPVHQGVLERGSKTGSFSYLLFEAHIGAFGVVIGKHYSNLNLPNLPFSYIFEDSGVSKIVPAMNLVSVGTVRDGEKWPKRDGRKAPQKRDLIIFDVFSPYTVEKMRRGREEMTKLLDKESRDKPTLSYGGGEISRQSLEKGVRRYSFAIKRYLIQKLMEKVAAVASQHARWGVIIESLRPQSNLKKASDWQDVAGLLTPCEEMAAVESQVTDGTIHTYDALLAEFQRMHDNFQAFEWQYVCETYTKEFGIALTSLAKTDLADAADLWEEVTSSLHGMILEDSKKEFGAFAQIGYGLDQDEETKRKDFEAVRGTSETNSVVKKLTAEAAEIRNRKEQFKSLVASISA